MSYLPIGNEVKKMWLIVEWKVSNKHNGYSLVSSEELTGCPRLQDLHTGKVVSVTSAGKKARKASIVIVSADKNFLEMEIKHLQEAAHQIGLLKKPPSKKYNSKAAKSSLENDDEEEEQFQSDSDWNQHSSDEDSDDSETCSKQKSAGNEKKNACLNNRSSKIPQNNYSHDKMSKHVMANPTGVQRFSLNSQQRSVSVFPEKSNISPSIQQYNVMEVCNYRNSDIMEEVIEQVPKTPSFIGRPRIYHSMKNEMETQHIISIVPPMTFDQQTQTNISNNDGKLFDTLYENQKVLSSEISYLHKTIDDLRCKIESLERTSLDLQNKTCIPIHNNSNVPVYQNIEGLEVVMESVETNNAIENNPILRDMSRCQTENYVNISANEEKVTLNNYVAPMIYPNHETPKAHAYSNNPCPEIKADGSDMVPIGSGKTLIPRHIYNQIKWNSYSYATRKLLMAVFPRRTLATHSLTGKCSPAFTNKPAKMQLDAKKITDIIMTVSQMCTVQESLVRNIITTKCSDENKMYRLRMEKMKNKKAREVNQENQSP